ncbi:hypothetical protein PG993_007459 [Apiospora rasikravindrae]|uniref:Uncharacterized protein n=1 Tax=Apiospora rasikravindrae TaxID=990691 RepID=A0ABR1SZT7_9PEZI
MLPSHKSLIVSSEEWTVAVISFLSAMAVRGTYRRWPQILGGVAILYVLVMALPSRLWLFDLGASYLKVLKWTPGNGSAGFGRGPRIVVFGGGEHRHDEPGVSGPRQPEYILDRGTLPRKLQMDCASYMSYIPSIDKTGGSVVSNLVYEMTLNHTLESRDATSGAAYDYSWLSTQYPTPLHLPDLQQQIDTFLASEPAAHPTQDTLWVFDFGFWDVWRLSAFPQDISFQLIEVLASVIFQEIDLLYQASREGQPDPNEAEHHHPPETKWRARRRMSATTTSSEDNTGRPFRVLIPRLFDVSVTPGFETARFRPPPPHSQADELRNAAYLTRHWDNWMDGMTERWLAMNTPTVEVMSTTGKNSDENDDDRSDPNMLHGMDSRREVINPNVSKYLLELIADRQLKNSGLEDSRGMGNMPADQAFGQVEEACLQPNTTTTAAAAVAVSGSIEMVPCADVDDYLFWDGFTVGPRAIRSIGQRAKDLVEQHIEAGAPWLKKAHVHYRD